MCFVMTTDEKLKCWKNVTDDICESSVINQGKNLQRMFILMSNHRQWSSAMIKVHMRTRLNHDQTTADHRRRFAINDNQA